MREPDLSVYVVNLRGHVYHSVCVEVRGQCAGVLHHGVLGIKLRLSCLVLGVFTHPPVLDLKEGLRPTFPKCPLMSPVVRFRSWLSIFRQACPAGGLRYSVRGTQCSPVWDNPGALATLKDQVLSCEPSPCTLECESPSQVRADSPHGWPKASPPTSPQALLVHR